MNEELLKKFWKDYYIPTQDEDLGFPFANPSDAARSLIKAHNWVGNITEHLMETSKNLDKAELEVSKLDSNIVKLERIILAANPPPNWAVKNRDMQKAFIWSKAGEDLELLQELEDSKQKHQSLAEQFTRELDTYYLMLKTLDKSTELAIQFINWIKYEAKLG